MGTNVFKKLKISKLVIIVSLLICIPVSLFSQGIPADYSKKNLWNFTNHLIISKDYYRAYIELQRVKSYYPTFLNEKQISSTEQFILYNSKNYSLMTKLQYKLPISRTIAEIFAFDYLAKDINAEKAKSLFTLKLLIQKHDEKILKDAIYKRYITAYSLGMLSSFDELNFIPKGIIKNYTRILNSRDKLIENYKSPALAAALGVIPGAGYMYSDKMGTGIVAFVIVALNALFSYSAFDSGNHALGYVFGTIGTFFYGGSIVGGYLETKKFNSNYYNTSYEFIQNEMQLEKDHNKIYSYYKN